MRQKGIIELNMSIFASALAVLVMLLLLVFSYFYYGYKAQRMTYFSATYLGSIDDGNKYQDALSKLNKLISSEFSKGLEVKIVARKTTISDAGNSKVVANGSAGDNIDCSVHDDNVIPTIPSGATIDAVSLCLYSPKYHVSISRHSFYLSETQ